MMRTADAFLPLGVPKRLYDALGYCPYRLPSDAAAHIEVLWAIRNAAPESEFNSIDVNCPGSYMDIRSKRLISSLPVSRILACELRVSLG
jgi:hypothetical protein